MHETMIDIASGYHLIKVGIIIITMWVAGSLTACATPGGYVVGWDSIHQIAKERRQLELEHGAPLDEHTDGDRAQLQAAIRRAR